MASCLPSHDHDDKESGLTGDDVDFGQLSVSEPSEKDSLADSLEELAGKYPAKKKSCTFDV